MARFGRSFPVRPRATPYPRGLFVPATPLTLTSASTVTGGGNVAGAAVLTAAGTVTGTVTEVIGYPGLTGFVPGLAVPGLAVPGSAAPPPGIGVRITAGSSLTAGALIQAPLTLASTVTLSALEGTLYSAEMDIAAVVAAGGTSSSQVAQLDITAGIGTSAVIRAPVTLPVTVSLSPAAVFPAGAELDLAATLTSPVAGPDAETTLALAVSLTAAAGAGGTANLTGAGTVGAVLILAPVASLDIAAAIFAGQGTPGTAELDATVSLSAAATFIPAVTVTGLAVVSTTTESQIVIYRLCFQRAPDYVSLKGAVMV